MDLDSFFSIYNAGNYIQYYVLASLFKQSSLLCTHILYFLSAISLHLRHCYLLKVVNFACIQPDISTLTFSILVPYSANCHSKLLFNARKDDGMEPTMRSS